MLCYNNIIYDIIYGLLCDASFDKGNITKYDNAKYDYEDDENDDVNDDDGDGGDDVDNDDGDGDDDDDDDDILFSSSAGTGFHMKETSYHCGSRCGMPVLLTRPCCRGPPRGGNSSWLCIRGTCRGGSRGRRRLLR
jgi:hypothetical protein